jgi:hypothetical protein
MTDDLPESGEPRVLDPDVEESPPKPPRKRRRWKWPLILFGIIVLIPALLFAIWSWISLTYTYSSGERAGYVQKFSEKGWVCKTWEGELSMVNIPGAAQERWQFSVRDDSVAAAILGQMGNRVALTYEEHRGVPTSCFGETSYFVKAVRKVAP